MLISNMIMIINQRFCLTILNLKNCLFGATNMVKTNDKIKYVYSANGIAFDGAHLRSFVDDFARNVIIFSVDNSSSLRTDNRKYNFFSIR